MGKIDQIAPRQTTITENPTVGCDGGDGALGHPLVYLTVGENGIVVCPYCSKRFVLKA